MYSKKLKNGKVRFYDTYKSLSGKRKQITVTLETSSAQSQRTAKNLLAQKVDKKLDDERQSLEAINNATISQVFKVYWVIREQEIASSYAYQEKRQFETFLNDFDFGKKKIKSVSIGRTYKIPKIFILDYLEIPH